jgi:hypothetical protein
MADLSNGKSNALVYIAWDGICEEMSIREGDSEEFEN